MTKTYIFIGKGDDSLTFLVVKVMTVLPFSGKGVDSLTFLVVKVTTQSMSADMCQEMTRAMSAFSIIAR